MSAHVIEIKSEPLLCLLELAGVVHSSKVLQTSNEGCTLSFLSLQADQQQVDSKDHYNEEVPKK